MNLAGILNEIVNADPDFTERVSPRRAAIKNITSFGSKVAVAALPFAVSTLFNKAYGQTLPSAVADTLNLALVLEYMESTFYNTALSSTALFGPGTEQAPTIHAADVPFLKLIQADENHHVAYLKGILGSQAVDVPVFDYTCGGGTRIGPFTATFTQSNYFYTVATVLEDTASRAYNGFFPALVDQPTLFAAAVNIHTVESRHSAHIRYVRQATYGAADTRPWVENNNSGISNPEVFGVYADEENQMQLGIDSLNTAFDEPMDATRLKFILNMFIKSPKLQ